MVNYATDQNPDPKPGEGDVWLEVIEKFKKIIALDSEDTDKIENLVIKDMEERRKFGIEHYGTPLQPHNGRDMLLDAYQEFLDFICYYIAYMKECGREDKIMEAFSFGNLYDLRKMIEQKDEK